MSTLREKRHQLRDGIGQALEAELGLKTFSTVPSKFIPPAVFIGPGDPYLTREGANYGCEVMRLTVVVVGDKGVNDVRADELDDLIEATLDALYDLEGQPDFEDLTVGAVGDPGPISPNGQGPYLSAPIELEIHVNRQEQP